MKKNQFHELLERIFIMKNYNLKEFRWKIHKICNFNCSYCLSKKNVNNCSYNIPKITQAAQMISQYIPSDWRLSLTGGELTIRMDLLLTCLQIFSQTQHHIKITTNGSAEISEYKQIFDHSNGNLVRLFISWHPEFMSFNELINKVNVLRKVLPESCFIVVRMVVLPTNESYKVFLSLREKYANQKESNIYIDPLLLLQSKGKYCRANYSNIDKLGLLANENNFFKNQLCSAGNKSLYMNDRFDLFPCISYSMAGIPPSFNLFDQGLKRIISDTYERCKLDECICS